MMLCTSQEAARNSGQHGGLPGCDCTNRCSAVSVIWPCPTSSSFHCCSVWSCPRVSSTNGSGVMLPHQLSKWSLINSRQRSCILPIQRLQGCMGSPNKHYFESSPVDRVVRNPRAAQAMPNMWARVKETKMQVAMTRQGTMALL